MSINNLKAVFEIRIPLKRTGFFVLTRSFFHSKQLQLLAWSFRFFLFTIRKNLHFTELFIRNA